MYQNQSNLRKKIKKKNNHCSENISAPIRHKILNIKSQPSKMRKLAVSKLELMKVYIANLYRIMCMSQLISCYVITYNV